MVAGKPKVTTGLQKSPSISKTDRPSPATKSHSPFSRSFFSPRCASAQVQPKPPDVADLHRVIEDLRERENALKTELLELKIVRETAAIVPALEKQLFAKNELIGSANTRISDLEIESEKLREMLEREVAKTKELESEVEELRKTVVDREMEIDQLRKASSQRFLGLMETSKSPIVGRASQIISILQHKKPGVQTNAKEFHEEKDTAVEEKETSVSYFPSVPHRIDVPRPPRIPKPPPKRASSSIATPQYAVVPPPPPPPPPPLTHKVTKKVSPPPPPPPPPMKSKRQVQEKVRRVPEVVEFYHSLMRRDSRKDTAGEAAATTANPRDMIGEIENRSTHLLAIKTDVETQGEFIRVLIKEVNEAEFSDIEDVVTFVKWLDDELSYLVDERAVLKHFEWPEQKADALREAAFGYCDLKKLQSEVSSLFDDRRQPCGSALKKMQSLFEKLEHGVHNLSRMRETVSSRFKGFKIPTDWMMESGVVIQIKLTSVKLAMKYMKRVSAEIEVVGGGQEEEDLIVQGVRFAFRVHQFAGGFDVDTMRAFQELRDKCHHHHHRT